MSPNDFESLPYYEFQILLDKVNKKVEESNKVINNEGKKEIFSLSAPSNI